MISYHACLHTRPLCHWYRVKAGEIHRLQGICLQGEEVLFAKVITLTSHERHGVLCHQVFESRVYAIFSMRKKETPKADDSKPNYIKHIFQVKDNSYIIRNGTNPNSFRYHGDKVWNERLTYLK